MKISKNTVFFPKIADFSHIFLSYVPLLRYKAGNVALFVHFSSKTIVETV